MNLKKFVAVVLALAVFIAAAPLSAQAGKKRKDGPDEPKLTVVLTAPRVAVQ